MDGRNPALAALASCALLGCGGSGKDANEPEPLDDSGLIVPKVDDKLCDTTGKRIETYDLNRDNKPDVWRVYETVTERGIESEVLTCMQVDYDKDGVKDYVARYRGTGEMSTEEVDLGFDDKFDTRRHYDKSTGKLFLVERDSNHDNKPDVWETFDKDEIIESVRRDTNGDGKPDIWEQYVKGELVAILYDDDYDNRVDRKEQIKVARPPPPKAEPDAKPPATEGPTPEIDDDSDDDGDDDGDG